MELNRRSLHRVTVSLLGSTLLLFALVLTISACRIPPFPPRPIPTNTPTTITDTAPLIGTPAPFTDSELWLSEPNAKVNYPMLRVITEETSLADFALSWVSPDIDVIAQLTQDPLNFKVGLLRAFNPKITTNLSPNDNLVLPHFNGNFTRLNQLVERIVSSSGEPEMLSEASESFIHTVIFLYPIDRRCFEENVGITLNSIEEFNPNLFIFEDDVIPANTVIFIPRHSIASTATFTPVDRNCTNIIGQ